MSQRILMIRLSAIGDVINVLPAVALLRRALPDAHLAFAVEDRAADVVRGHPMIDEVIVFPRRQWRAMLHGLDLRQLRSLGRELAAYRRRLRDGRFDVVLDFQGNLKGAAHVVVSGAPRRIGFARGFDREGNHWFSNEHVTPPADRPHRVDKFASLLAPLGVHAGSSDLHYVLPESPDARARIDAWLEQSGLAADATAGRGFVVLHPGTSDRGAEKRWPPDRFAELARRIAGELGRRAVVTWGPGEEDLARSICERSGGAATLGPRTCSLLELAALLRRASAFVSADTGPMHLAAACGTSCIALFGPKDPAVYRPWGEQHVVLHGDASGGMPAMHRIEVADVLRAVSARLSPT